MPSDALRLRPSMLSDLDAVVAIENDPHNLPFITPWDLTQHSEQGYNMEL